MDLPPHLDIDLNEAPSPPPSPPPAVPLSPPREFALPIFAPLPPLPPPAPLLPPPPPPAPVNSQAQLLLAHEAREIALRPHQAETLRVVAARTLAAAAAAVGSSAGVPQPAQHPGEAGWGHPPLPCASCGHPEIPGATIVCDACERGFHESCVRVWPPLMSLPPPPPSRPPGVRRPPVAVNEDWMCPECEMHGARSTRWRLGPVPLDINAAPPEDPVTVAVRDITRQLSQLPINFLLMVAAHLIINIHSSKK